jgi:hypothetical protein
MLLERMKLASHDSIGLDGVFFHEEGAHVFDEAAREESRLVACAAVIIVDKARRRPWRGQASGRRLDCKLGKAFQPHRSHMRARLLMAVSGDFRRPNQSRRIGTAASYRKSWVGKRGAN